MDNTQVEREARRQENEKTTQEAIKLASLHQAEDYRNGQKPIITEIQDIVKQKLIEKYGDNPDANAE